MIRTSAVLAALFVFFVAQGSAVAGNAVGEVYVTPSVVYLDDDQDRDVKDDFAGFQVNLGYAWTELFNVELFANSLELEGAQDLDQLEFGANLLAVFNREGIFSPYLLAGISQTETEQVFGDDNGEAASNVGLGFFLDLGATPLSLRGEWRFRQELSGFEYDEQVATLGLQYTIGGGKPRVVDTDRDECPNTPAGAAVDSRGCELDSDGDGVVNSKDKCPNTPAGAPVDANGCELDSDGDGVVDRLDECPNTAKGVPVDIRGCEIKDVIRLRGVNFETNSDRLLPTASQILNDAAETLKRNPQLQVEVAGHTDSDGAAAYNQGLSERRARTVMDYLISRGVDESKLSFRGYGESQPIADNATRAGKAENRRVELRILNR